MDRNPFPLTTRSWTDPSEAEQYEVKYTESSWRGNPDSECCREGTVQDLAILETMSIDPGWEKGVYVTGGCPPFT